MINRITPVILTYNEAPNIRRTLEKLSWAREIVVVDSFSTDETLSILSDFKQVKIHQRKFDSHAHQWNYAIRETQISSEWVLALDADYLLTEDFIAELKAMKPAVDIVAYKAQFTLCIFGRPLRASLYPPVTVLFRGDSAHYEQDGHTQILVPHGKVGQFHSRILHDDRKSLTQWLSAQDRYQRLECDKLSKKGTVRLNLPDRIRKTCMSGPLLFFYCLFGKGLILDGWAGLYYTLQRVLAEVLLSLRLIETGFKRKDKSGT